MASLVKRGNLFWLKYHDPLTLSVKRVSLKTVDAVTAELLRQKAEAELFLRRPNIAALALPQELGGMSADGVSNSPPLVPIVSHTASETLKQYREFVRTENVARHASTKLSRLERFFGSTVTGSGESITGVFKGRYLHEVTAPMVEKFINELRDNRRTGGGKPVTQKTKLGYREVFHHFFEFAIRRGLFTPTNPRYPNPMSTLPNWRGTPSVIVYLPPEKISQLLDGLKNDPKLRLAVAIMIFAGLRRAEMLSLQWDNVDLERNLLSVTYVADPLDIDGKCQAVNSLKTVRSNRSVPIFPELKPLLEAARTTSTSAWVIPSPRGMLWDVDHFSTHHRATLKQLGRQHTCLHYRHTFATLLARKHYSLFQIAQLMGNSATICEKHYAAFVLPEHAVAGNGLLT